MIKLAIIIPFYKLEYFEDTIKSLFYQTNQNFNIYIGNDNSVDDPLPIINKYLNSGRYQYYKYDENLGSKSLPSQWQRILDNVTEEWFEILGDDDSLAINFVEEFYNNLEKFDDVNVIKTKPILFDKEGNLIRTIPDYISSGKYSSLQFFVWRFDYIINSSLSEHIFRNKVFKKIGFENFPLAWHTDDWLILRMTNMGNLIYLSETSVNIRIFEQSISGSSNNLDLKRAASKQFFNKLASGINFKSLDYKLSKDVKRVFHVYWKNLEVSNLIKCLGIYKIFKTFIYEFVYQKIKKVIHK